VLKENVLHHMEEEETDLLPKVREKLDERRRRELGGAMVQAWRIAPTRPHPRAPDTPPGNLIAGVQGAAADVAVETARGATAAAGEAAEEATDAMADAASDASDIVQEVIARGERATTRRWRQMEPDGKDRRRQRRWRARLIKIRPRRSSFATGTGRCSRSTAPSCPGSRSSSRSS
jgi:hypothetical protein